MNKPDLGFWKLWNLSFGFFGVQIAYALQSAQVSRIFSTIGADPHDLSYFWILPPLMGLIVQPIVGSGIGHKHCQYYGAYITYNAAGIAQERLYRICQTFLFFVYKITHEHLERLHCHVYGRVQEHEHNQAEDYSRAHRQTQRPGVGQEAHDDDGGSGADEPVG